MRDEKTTTTITPSKLTLIRYPFVFLHGQGALQVPADEIRIKQRLLPELGAILKASEHQPAERPDSVRSCHALQNCCDCCITGAGHSVLTHKIARCVFVPQARCECP